MRRFVVGDIHGARKALTQVLERASFSDSDKLITLGDVVDGWPESKQTIDVLLQVKNRASVLGNHDQWFCGFLTDFRPLDVWVTQGGAATLRSYGFDLEKGDWLPQAMELVPEAHVDFIESCKLWHTELGPHDTRDIFVHGGFDPTRALSKQTSSMRDDSLMWNRQLVTEAFKRAATDRLPQSLGRYERCFVGHTPVSNFIRKGPESVVPQQWGRVVAMDTGAGWPGGKLSLKDLDTGEVFQSDFVEELYPNAPGRRGY